jgi:hypothetical protein
LIKAAVRASRVVLFVFFASFLALAYAYVPRLTNSIWSDVEFTGWVSPIAHRIALGERIYQDFTLPIPPGSFLLLAAVQKLTGRFLLLDELWVCALSNLLMMGVGYWLVRPFTGGRNAVLATVLAAPLVILTPKEIAYDQTAQVVAWTAAALLARALCTEVGRRRDRWLTAAGFAAAFTLAFKSSTGSGAVLGVLLALAAITAIAWRHERLAGLRALRSQWASLFAGLALGAAATAVVVLLAGGALAEFYQVVFVDGPALKGGKIRMVLNLLSYTLFQAPVHASFVMACLIGWLLSRLAGSREGLLLDTEPQDDDPDVRSRAGLLFAGGVSAAVLVLVAVALGLLWSGRAMIPSVIRTVAGVATVPPSIGLLFLAVFLVTHLTRADAFAGRRAAFAATTLCAGSISLMHNLSHPQHRPFYDNNPIIPLVFLTLLVLLDRASAPRLKYALFALTLFGLFGDKFQRYMDARHPVDDPSFWQGLRISDNGMHVLRAAQRARELAGPDGTVLMLPEDPATEALIGRRRPPLRGAIAFVDQYPAHVLRADLARLQQAPPDVLVLQPNDHSWNRVYRIWTLKSAAAKLQTEFLDSVRGGVYQSDSTYPTWFFNQPSTLEVFVKRQAEPQPPTE